VVRGGAEELPGRGAVQGTSTSEACLSVRGRMSFLNPFVLLALAAAAIPLLIHLLNLRKPQQVDFSSLTFIKELQRSTMQRVKIKQWLLLALRTLALLFLILAFARPTLTGNLAGVLGGQGPAVLGVVVDTSPSMMLREGGRTPLDRAREAAQSIVGLMEANDEVQLSSTQPPAGDPPGAFQNRSVAQDAVQAVDLALNTEHSAQSIARMADRVAEAEQPTREVYLLSDLQATLLADTLTYELPDDVQVYLVPTGSGEAPANVAVTDVAVVSRVVEAGQPVTVEATLVHYGADALPDYTASLYLEEERVAQATATLEPEVETPVRFTMTPEARGWLAGRVTIEDDDFPHDDTRHFSLHVPEQRRVLLVEGQGQRARFARLALTAQPDDAPAAFTVDTVPKRDLSATRLGTYDAVFLVGPQRLSSGEVADLTRYIENGGGLMLFPSAGARADSYNALLQQVGGGTFTGFSGSIGAEEPVASFDRVALEHPLFEGVFDEQPRSGPGGTARAVEAPDLFYLMNYQPGAGTEQTLIQLTNRLPFLQEVRHERGALLTMAVAPDPAWSDLPLRGLFVPLLYRSAQYLAAGSSVQGDQFLLGMPGELRLSDVDPNTPVYLDTPDGERFLPDQRRVFGATLVQLGTDIAVPGLYDVGQGEGLLRRVAFNLAPRHSDLRRAAPADAAERLSDVLGTPVQVLDIAEGGVEQISRALTEQRRGVELWNVFLLLSLLFLVAEMAVARQWRPEAA